MRDTRLPNTIIQAVNAEAVINKIRRHALLAFEHQGLVPLDVAVQLTERGQIIKRMEVLL